MTRTQTTAKQLLVNEIARARAHLEGRSMDDQDLARIFVKDYPALIQDAQLLREALMLRQQREVAEHVRSAIERERMSLAPTKPVLAS